MLAVLRFSFSKELKFVRARLGKPYNSALGKYLAPHFFPFLLIGLSTRGADDQVNISAVLGDYLPCSSMRRRKNQSSERIFMFLLLENRRMAVKEDQDGPHPSCGLKMVERRVARRGE